MHDIMYQQTGIVIPIYLPKEIDTSQIEKLLRDNVKLCCRQVSNPEMVCLSVDGEAFGSQLADRLAKELGVSICVSPENRGKLQAVAAGMRTLLDSKDPTYLAIIDQDGDHLANELLNFVTTAQHIAEERATDRVLVLGRRISRHQSLGFLRGELEELADRMLLDALFYRAAVAGRPLPLEYVTTLDEYPDVHSGYKLFSRRTARDVFLTEPQAAGVSDDCYYRHACEAVMVVEALESGAYLGAVNRTSTYQQPVSTFGLLDANRLTADMIIWPCKRLEIPPSFVNQWLANHVPRLSLGTLSPKELDEVVRLVSSAFGGKPEDNIQKRFPRFV